MQGQDKDDRYFVTLQGEEFVNSAIVQVQRYQQFIRTRGLLAIWRKVYWEWNKALRHLGQLTRVGQKGEYMAYWVNKFRNIITRYHTLITSVKPDIECQATNSDYKSQAQTKAAQILLQYIFTQRNFQKCLDDADLETIKYGESFVELGWNERLGRYLGEHPETGAPTYEGDFFFKNIPTWDLIRDPHARSFESLNWYMVRDWVNRFEFAEEWPAHREAILATSAPYEDIYINQWFISWDANNDWIPVYRFYHKRSPILPEGRMVIFCDKTMIFDGELPYKDVPVYRNVWQDLTQGPFAYSAAFDMLQPQKMLDMINSQTGTNQSNFGTQIVTAPIGNNINPVNVAGGLAWVEYTPNPAVPGGGKPEGLNLTATNPIALNLATLAAADQQELMGMNPTAMGNPPPGKDSGKAIGQLIDVAYSFSQTMQSNRNRLIEDSAMGLINIVKTYGNVESMEKIVGSFNKSLMKAFADDHLNLDTIDRIIAKQGNPATNTKAGRQATGLQLLEFGLITAKQYLSIMETGSLEPAIEGIDAENMLIKEENERIINGEEVIAIVTQDHQLHIIGHKAVLSNYDNIMDDNIRRAALEHIQEHIYLQEASQSNTNILQVQDLGRKLTLQAQLVADQASQIPAQTPQQPNLVMPNANIQQPQEEPNGNEFANVQQ